MSLKVGYAILTDQQLVNLHYAKSYVFIRSVLLNWNWFTLSISTWLLNKYKLKCLLSCKTDIHINIVIYMVNIKLCSIVPNALNMLCGNPYYQRADCVEPKLARQQSIFSLLYSSVDKQG